MKKALLFSLFIFTYLNAAATSNFSLIVHKPFDSALFDITEDYDRTISAVGFVKNYKQNSSATSSYTNAFDYLANVSNNYGYQMHLIKVNSKAKIILSKTAKINQFNTAVSLQKTSTNGYFIGGYTMNGSLLLVKLDAQGNLLYYKEFGTKNFDKMNSLVSLRDGGVLAVGFSVTSRNTHDNMFETGLGNDDIFITRFSKEGQILWSKKFGTAHDDRGISAAEANDGSIMILATTQYDKNKDITLMRLGENGNKIWLKHLIYKELTEAKKIIKLKDGNFLIALSQYDNFNKEHVRLIKFDLYKNILIDKNISTTYSSVLNDIGEFSNGKIIGAGYVKDKFNTDGLVMIFDSNLELLNQAHYGNKNYDTFNALHILHNSQVAVAGIHTDNNSQEENMWLLKLNNDATIAQISTATTKLYTNLCNTFKSEIKNNKITITKDLTINFIDDSLHFKVGKYKLNAAQKRFLTLFDKKLLTILSLYKNSIETLEINGYTSSEWKKNNFQDRYLKNANLSMKRSFETLKYLFTHQNKSTQKWLTTILQGTGLSYKDRIVFKDKEDKEKSRRVTFKIILK
ncbi:hypothetical protein [Sulfurimonas sp.]